MIPVAAVLAALSMAEKFLDHPLCQRLLQNWARKTTNKIDDWVLSVLYGVPEEYIPAELTKVQERYNGLRPEEKAAALVTIPMPWIDSDS